MMSNYRVSGYYDPCDYYDPNGKYWIDGVCIKRGDRVAYFGFRAKIIDRLGEKFNERKI